MKKSSNNVNIPSNNTEEMNYWNTEIGQNSLTEFPEASVPLEQRSWEWNQKTNNKSHDIAQGSAYKIVKQVNNNYMKK